MLKKIACSLILLMGSASAFPKLPPLRELEKVFSGKGFEYFLKQTSLLKRLAKKNLSAMGVVMVVDSALYDYYQDLKKSGLPEQQLNLMTYFAVKRKSEIIKTILKDEKEAIKELEDCGLLEK